MDTTVTINILILVVLIAYIVIYVASALVQNVRDEARPASYNAPYETQNNNH